MNPERPAMTHLPAWESAWSAGTQHASESDQASQYHIGALVFDDFEIGGGGLSDAHLHTYLEWLFLSATIAHICKAHWTKRQRACSFTLPKRKTDLIITHQKHMQQCYGGLRRRG